MPGSQLVQDKIAGFEDSTCGVIVGLIHRARRADIATSPAAVVLDAAQLGTVLSALADAAEYRRKEAGHWWADCQASPAEARETHLDDLDAAQAYEGTAARRGCRCVSAGARCRAGAGYEVSDLGRVRSVPRILSDGRRAGRVARAAGHREDIAAELR